MLTIRVLLPSTTPTLSKGFSIDYTNGQEQRQDKEVSP